MCSRHLLLSAPIVLTATSVATAQPVAIPVANPGFEANFAAPNSFPVLVPTGWQRYDPGNILDFNRDALGVLNPTGSTFFPGGAPEGTNVALVYLEGDRGTTPVGFFQIVPAQIQSQTRYRLTVEVGNIASGAGAPPFDDFFDLSGFPGYAVQILAGTSLQDAAVVAEDFNLLHTGGLDIPEGEFRLSTVVFDVAESHARLGQGLAIRLINLNQIDSPASPGIEVDFDDVRFTAEPLPVTPTCPPDLNGDANLDPDDLADFIACYFGAACPLADYNGNGATDPDDLADYIAAYFGGCG